MDSPLSRRAWLTRSATATLGVAVFSKITSAGESQNLPRTGAPRMKLSLAAYSFRDFFKDTTAKRTTQPAKVIDMFDFVDYCAEHNCDAETTSYYFPANADGAYLRKLKRHAFLRGVAISGGAIGNTFTHPAGADREKEVGLFKKWCDRYVELGAPHIRVFAGAIQKNSNQEAAIANTIETMKEACDYAGDRGIFLGLENHGGIVAEPGPLLHIVKSVNSPWLGINLDSGNFQTEDPYADFAKCAPLAVNVQLKTEVHPKGKPVAHSDIKRLVKILADAKYQGYVALEFEEKLDPWQTVPGVLNEIRAALNAA
jgi:sugar phosphate isomerase/epimerase